MTAQEWAANYKTEIADLPSATLRTFDTPERDQYWQWLVDNIGFNNLESYLEIGSNCGYSLWMMYPFFQLEKPIRALTVDIGKGATGQPQAWQKTCNLTGAIAAKGKSGDFAELVVNFVKPFDLVLIDADHSYEGVKADWQGYKGAVKPGGYVVFHDTRAKNMGVYRLWNEIKSGFAQTWELGGRQGIGIGRIKV
jgi:predicted O-methyltransferase YrrM